MNSQDLFQSWGEPAYRAKQVWSRLYQKLAASFDEMSELPKALRQRLAQETVIGTADAARRAALVGRADAQGSLCACPMARRSKSVLMGYERRRTTCISTQAGCGMGCSFCATGQGGLQRNLTSGEIVEQVLFFAREPNRSHRPIPNLQSPISSSWAWASRSPTMIR